MTEKIIGYVLLIIGVVIIIFSAISVWGVFTKKTQPVQLFNFEGISLDVGGIVQQNLSQSLPPEAAGLLKQQASSQPTEIIPPDLINDSSNIFAHLILMGFIASIGFKIASLGVMLVRPVVVKLKAKEEMTTQQTSSVK